MEKEETLSEKEISWHEEGVFYNGNVFAKMPLVNGDRIFRKKDVNQCFKKILDEIRKLEGGINKEEGEIDLKIWMRDVVKIIKQNAGEKLIE